MEVFILKALYYIACVMSPIYIFMFLNTLHSAITYADSLQESIDALNGVRTEFYPLRAFIYAVIWTCIGFALIP